MPSATTSAGGPPATSSVHDVLAPGLAEPLDVHDLRLPQHLDAMRVDQVQVADLVDRIERRLARFARAAGLAGEPDQSERRDSRLDELENAQRNLRQLDRHVAGGGRIRR